MKIKTLTFSPFQENTYVVWDENTKDAIIVDPSCLYENEEKVLENFILQNELTVKYLFNTHGHLDHIFGNAFVVRTFNPIHYGPEKDLPLFDRAVEQAEGFGLKMQTPPKPNKFFDEAEKIQFGDEEITLIFTPGHTPGEYCIFFPKSKFCITGDVLFKESIGRTDLWGGNYNTLMNSIKNKLLTLPLDTAIYPGHGENSSINYELENNPFLS